MGREFESLRGHETFSDFVIWRFGELVIGTNHETTRSLNHQINWGVSSAGLEHYLDRVGVIGSNPIHPTKHLEIFGFGDLMIEPPYHSQTKGLRMTQVF